MVKFQIGNSEYAWEPATGDLGLLEQGQAIDSNNPQLFPKPLAGGRLRQLNLEVTQACNLKCRYCMHTHQGVDGVRPHRPKSMTWDIAKLAMKEVETRGAEDVLVCLYGGEPLLNFGLIQQIIETWPQYQYEIATNGQLVTGQIARWAAGRPVRWQISVDGIGEANDRYRGPGTFAGVERAVERIQAARWDATIRLALTLAPPWRLPDAAALVDRFSELPFTAVFADLKGSGIEQEYLDLSKWRALYVDLCSRGRRDKVPRLFRELFEPSLIKFYHRKHNKRFYRWVPGGCCNPGVRRLYADADGRYFPCERVGVGFQIGDVWSGVDWPSIERMHQNFFQNRINLGCASCEIVRICGGCWEGPVDCQREKEKWKTVMETYVQLAEAGALSWLKDTSLR